MNLLWAAGSVGPGSLPCSPAGGFHRPLWGSCLPWICHLLKTMDNKENDEDEVSRVTCKKQETTKKTKRMKKTEPLSPRWPGAVIPSGPILWRPGAVIPSGPILWRPGAVPVPSGRAAGLHPSSRHGAEKQNKSEKWLGIVVLVWPLCL